VNGTDDVGDLRDRPIGQGAVRTLGGRTPQELRNRFALTGGRAAYELVKLLIEANTTHARPLYHTRR
jgi:hypothetical protein